LLTQGRAVDLSDEVLQHNARMLEDSACAANHPCERPSGCPHQISRVIDLTGDMRSALGPEGDILFSSQELFR
jgi:hypothetical protein